TEVPYSVSWDTTPLGNGVHHLSAVARDTSGNFKTSSAVAVTVDNPDTVNPTVSMTAPVDGATINGLVSLSADASDDVGVVGVQFLVDGVPFGAEDVAAPYSVDWDSTAVANG